MKKIAISSRYSLDADKLINFANKYEFDGIEYSIQSENLKDLNLELDNIKKLSDSRFEIRYHMPFNEIELAHKNNIESQKALEYYKVCFDELKKLNAHHVIIHLCLGYRNNLDLMDYNNAFKNLIEVTKYGKQNNIEVCLENLTFGLNDTPEKFLDFLEKSSCKATVDIGHIAASDVVRNDKITEVEYISQISEYIESAHIYNIEDFDEKVNGYVHFPPKKEKDIAERVVELMKSPCNWFLIELGDEEHILRTKEMLKKLLI